MILYHGTRGELLDEVRREGLRGHGRPVFLAETAETARRYSRSRAAEAFVAGADPVGLLVLVEVDEDVVEPDPWSAIGEPGQHRTGDVLPAAIVEMVEVRFPWVRLGRRAVLPSVSLAAGLADAVALGRARADAQDRWGPQTVETVSRDVAALDAIVRQASRRR